MMRVKNIVAEDFVNYKKPSMFIASCFCDWKCCTESGNPFTMCQNQQIAKQSVYDIPNETILKEYKRNVITQAVVIGGLEPLLQKDEVIALISLFRTNDINDDFVIYTGFNASEVQNFIDKLVKFKNIVVKFGRFIPNQKSHFDTVLGVNLASENQYAERIS